MFYAVLMLEEITKMNCCYHTREKLVFRQDNLQKSVIFCGKRVEFDWRDSS